MAEMSPLARLLITILQKGSWAAGAFVLLFAGILLYQRLTPEGSLVLQKGDLAFFGVLVVLLLFAIYLVRSIAKELRKPGG